MYWVYLCITNNVLTAHQMAPQLEPFPTRKAHRLQVFFPELKAVVMSFEKYLPEFNSICNIKGPKPSLPGAPIWLKEGFDYQAFLPKDQLFTSHLLTPLSHCRPLFVQRDGQWYVDDRMRDLWQALNHNILNSIRIVGRNMLVDLKHYEPKEAVAYGFVNGHKLESGLRISLNISQNTFIHRIAYLTYVVSLRH